MWTLPFGFESEYHVTAKPGIGHGGVGSGTVTSKSPGLSNVRTGPIRTQVRSPFNKDLLSSRPVTNPRKIFRGLFSSIYPDFPLIRPRTSVPAMLYSR